MFKAWKNTESINPKVLKTNNGKTMILSKCAICDAKISRFIKKQEAKGLLSSNDKMTEMVNKLLLAGDKFMLEMHLKQSEFA